MASIARHPDRRSVLYTIAGSDLTTFDDAVIAMRDLDSGVVTELVRGGSYPVSVGCERTAHR